MNAEDDAEALKLRFAKYAKYGSKFEKAAETVASRGVKEHRFRPSGRAVYTVVGNLGDEFVNPQTPYCSCSNFYFRVLPKREELCYHLLSYMMAFEAKRFDIVDFSDDEYVAVVTAIVKDVYHVLDRSVS